MGTGGIEIRKADVSDVEWIIGELKEFSQFYGTKKQLFPKEEYARDTMISMIANHLVLIAERPSLQTVRIGFIAGVFMTHSYNPDILMLHETFWWVPEKYRNTRAGLLLLETFIAIGKLKTDWIVMSIQKKTPVKDESLLSRGFVPYDRSFLMEVV